MRRKRSTQEGITGEQGCPEGKEEHSEGDKDYSNVKISSAPVGETSIGSLDFSSLGESDFQCACCVELLSFVNTLVVVLCSMRADVKPSKFTEEV